MCVHRESFIIDSNDGVTRQISVEPYKLLPSIHTTAIVSKTNMGGRSIMMFARYCQINTVWTTYSELCTSIGECNHHVYRPKCGSWQKIHTSVEKLKTGKMSTYLVLVQHSIGWPWLQDISSISSYYVMIVSHNCSRSISSSLSKPHQN